MAATNRSAVLLFAGLLLVLFAAVTWWLVAEDDGDAHDGLDSGAGAALASDAAAGDVDLVGDATERGGAGPDGGTDGTRRAAIGGGDAAGADAAGGFRVTGQVVLPAGTPDDETLLVVALDDAADLDRLDDLAPAFDRVWRDVVAGEDGAEEDVAEGDFDAEAAIDAEIARRSDASVLAAVRASSSGAFELSLDTAGAVHVVALGRYVFAHGSQRVARSDADDVRLSVELGAWVTGRLVPATDAVADLDGTKVQLEPDVLGGFDVSMLAVFGHRRDGVCDASGAFEIRGVPAMGAYALRARPEAFAAVRLDGVELAPGERTALEIAVGTGATLRGVVVDEEGAPIADADVAARWSGRDGRSGDALRLATTAADGAFELAHVSVGAITVSAGKRGRLGAREPLQGELAHGDVVEGLRLVLGRGGRIRGRVEYVDGRPAPSAEVAAVLDVAAATAGGGMGMGMGLENARGGTADCDDDGSFEITGVTEHPFRIVADVHATQATARPVGDVDGDSDDDVDPQVVWRATKGDVYPGDEEHVLVLARLLELTGRAVDASTSEPLTAFEVRAMLEGSGGAFNLGAQRSEESFDEAEDGLFQLAELEAGVWSVVVSAEGYADSAPVSVELPQDEGARVDIALQPAASVAGIVLDPFGAPVGGATIAPKLGLAERIEAQSTGAARTIFTRGDGTFVFDGLAAGSLAIVADDTDFAPSESVAVDLVAGERVEGVVLTLREGGVLTGEVFGDDGAPAVGLLVSIQLMPEYAIQHLSESDDDGRFQFERLTPGRWQVTALPSTMDDDQQSSPADQAEMFGQLKMATAQVTDGESTHVVLGAPPSDPVALTGVVLRGGEPVAGAMVSIVPETDGDAIGAMRLEVTDDEGRFEAQLDAPAPLLLSVQSDFADGVQNTVEFIESVPPGSSTYDVVLELPGGSISGTVRDADGRPLPRARVTVEVRGGVTFGHLTGTNYVETATDDDGRYRANDLGAGEYAVSAGGASFAGVLGALPVGGRVVREGVRVGDDEQVTGVDFDLPAAVELVGRVVDGSGTAVAGASVFVRHESGAVVDRMSFIETDDAGRFRYQGLAPGSYTVHARKGGAASAEFGPVALDAKRSGDVELVLAAGTVLSVKVVDPRADASDPDADAGAISVSVRDEGGREYAGYFSLSELMQGMGSWFSTETQRVGPVPPGRYTVTATHVDGRSRDRRVVVDGGERTVVVRLR